MWKSTCLVGLLVSASLCAADQPPAPTLDDQLLRGLGESAPSQPRPARVGEDLGEPSQDEPLAVLVQQMQSVGQRLRSRDTSSKTQKLQSDVVRQLSALIDQLEQQAGTPDSSSAANAAAGNQTANEPGDATQANTHSNSSAATAGAEDAKTLVESVWGLLPSRLRQEIQSPVHEEFLPQYERLIREYYKRVAEEQGSRRRRPGD